MIGISHPKGAALEYSELAANPYAEMRCGFGCTYCYIGNMPFSPASAKNRLNPSTPKGAEYLALLDSDCAKLQAQGVTGQIFFTFTGDMYAPGTTLEYTRTCYKIVHNHGFGVNLLTKGGTLSVRDIDLFDPARDCYGATLTTLDYLSALEWEQNAPGPGNRALSLGEFHRAGIFTWVSIEPAKSTAETLDIIDQTHEYVDLYKIGGISGQKSSIDWQDYVDKVRMFCGAAGVKHYFKAPLQKYLPAGYYNPLRIPMHK